MATSGQRILDAFREAGYARTAILPVVASDFGVPQHRRRVFVFGLRDGLPFQGDFADTAEALIGRQKHEHTVTVREALSDLPEAVSQDDGPLPYPKKPGGRYSDFQKLMRLDWDQPLLSSARKRGDMVRDALHNHHTKGVEARRKRIFQLSAQAHEATRSRRNSGTALEAISGDVSIRTSRRTRF